MTCLIRGFKTKKDLKALDSQALLLVRIEDPSIFAPFYGTVDQYMSQKPTDRFAVCLDHPKRTKFAEILKRNGKVIVL